MTLRDVVNKLFGVDGDHTVLDSEVTVRVVRRHPSGSGAVVAHKIVRIDRISHYRGRTGSPVLDIVIEKTDLDAATEELL